jgi:tRNA C32,U32 (ribose-2'-O)-methylase TrmJ
MKSPLLAFILSSGLSSGTDFNSENLNDKTDSGIDKLQLMLKFISVLDTEENNAKIEFGKLKSWLYSQLKRKLTAEEEISLLQGILDYLQTEPGTPERMETMNYLFDAKFINNIKNKEK